MNFFSSNQYPIHSKEALLFSCGLLLSIFLLMVPFYFTHSLHWFHAILATIWIDLTIGAGGMIYRILRPSALSRNISLILSYILLLCIFLALALLLKRHLPKILLALFVASLVTTIITSIANSRPLYIRSGETGGMPKNTGRGNILFLILDEHIGIDGIPEEMKNGQSLRKDLIDLYTNLGFTIFGQAYSNYQWTTSSLYSIFNATSKIHFDPEIKLRFDRNRLLSQLQQQGYPIRLYESSWVDFGSTDLRNVSKFVYNHNSLGYIHGLPLSVMQKLRVLVDGFIFGYKSVLLQTMQRFKWEPETFNRKLGALASDRVIQEMTQDLGKFPKGHVFVAHLSLPHHPFLLDSDCKLKDPDVWKNRALVGPRQSIIPLWKDKYEMYFDQVRCTHHKVQTLLDDLHKTGLFDSTTIVLMGDHGSRIAMEERPDSMMPRDYLDWFSAFLAIKPAKGSQESREMTAGYRSGKVSVRTVISQYFGITPEAESQDPAMVCIFSKDVCNFKTMPDFPLWKQ